MGFLKSKRIFPGEIMKLTRNPYILVNMKHDIVLFLTGKKRTKRSRHRGGATKKRPPLCTPPAASLSDHRKCTDFRWSTGRKLLVSEMLVCKNRDIFVHRLAMRRGIPTGAHFRSAPLVDFFGSFLVRYKKGTSFFLSCLQKCMDFCPLSLCAGGANGYPCISGRFRLCPHPGGTGTADKTSATW